MFETKRLYLLPLSVQQMEWWLYDIAALEKDLNARYQDNLLEGRFRQVVMGQLAIMKQKPDELLFHTFWLLLRKTDRVIVGAADFKNKPNMEGQVEIGYGINQAFEGQGYTTEAVAEMCNWAFQNSDVNIVVAETEKGNLASQRVLNKCGFVRQNITGNNYWWIKEKR